MALFRARTSTLAVTLAVALRGKLKWRSAAYYWVAQLVGAVLAAGALFFVLGGAGTGLGATLPAPQVSPLQAIVVEGLLTFLLANAVLQTAVRKPGTPFAGLAIGLTLAAAILMGGPLTGASLNPARTFGPALFTGNLGTFWISFDWAVCWRRFGRLSGSFFEVMPAGYSGTPLIKTGHQARYAN